MCGIAGFYSKKEGLAQKEVVLNRMLTRIRYRGPDEAGIYLSQPFAMGNVRLSIIDLSSGQQPLCTKDGTKWIAYNGEVFNYPELRQRLEKLGHSFKTNCDTEVVLHMFEEFGADCLNELNGQFAFAIWDEKAQSLFLARDRFGIRPLYYTQVDNAVIFASEVKCILEYPGVERGLNFDALKQAFTFWAPRTPNTVFKGIKELSPGHYLIFKNKQISVQQYWRHHFSKAKFSGTINEASEELYTLLKDSVRMRLRADVQVAAYLSGGIDSSVTTSLVKEIEPSVLNTFSIGFEDHNYDETNFQKQVADYLKTNHHSNTCTNADIADFLPQAIYHTENPILRTSPIPMMLLAGLVNKHQIKVVLTGEGADEMLGGYNIFKEAIIRQFWAKYPDSKFRPLLLKKLYPYIPQLADASPSMLRMFFGYQLNQTDSPVYSHLLRWRNGNQLINFLNKETQLMLNGTDPIADYIESIEEQVSQYSSIEKAQHIETNLFMSGYLLSSQGDRMAMANSVEGRYPFLDHRVAEFCSTLPDDYKIKGLNEKILLKVMMKDKLPSEVLKRPKQAYRAPVANAIVNNNLLLDEYLNSSSINKEGLFDHRKVETLINKLRKSGSSSEQENMALMAVLSTQILSKTFISDYRELSDSDLIKSVVRNSSIIVR